MSMTVHESLLAEHLEKGYVEVGRKGERVDIAHPKDTCLHKMRGWSEQTYDYIKREIDPVRHIHHGFCLMTLGHRGRHSTIVYFCDICDQARRGTPSYRDNNVKACFMCSGLHGNYPYKPKKPKREVMA